MVSVSIYTISGKMIYKRETTCESGFNRILWDGKDLDGDRIANGVYLYKIIAESVEKELVYGNLKKAEYKGKIAIAR